MKPFEDVLAAGGSLVAAWDHHDDDRTRLCLFSVGSAGATIEASTTVPLDQQEAMVERLIAKGVRIGGSYARSTFVWTASEQEFWIWSHKTSKSIPRTKLVAGVAVFFERAGHRGVRVTLANGGHEIVADEHDSMARIDPAYDIEDLEADTRWARYLAEDLAVWFLVPMIDEITKGTIDPDLAIARALRGLADEVAGSSVAIVKSLGPIGDARELVYRCTADTLEIQVTGATTSTAVLKHGTRAQIAAFLRRVSTPATTLWAMNDLLYKQPRAQGTSMDELDGKPVDVKPSP
jgi:hypothetical protein